MEAEIIHAALPFPEGLAWSPADGAVIISATQGGHVYRLDAGAKAVRQVADVLGGANNITLAADGSIIVAQNGGIAAGASPHAPYPPITPARPGLQRIAPDGQVEYILSEGVNAPNDLKAHPDGSIYFTDPGAPRQGPDYVGGRVMRFDARAGLSILADGLFYPNGVAIDAEGDLLITERRGLMRITPDGRKAWVVETLTEHGGDGLTIDEQGRYVVSMRRKGGAQVIAPDGRWLDFIPIPGGGMVTNCCFGGPDLDWLIMTDVQTGDLCIVRDLPFRGRAQPLAKL